MPPKVPEFTRNPVVGVRIAPDEKALFLQAAKADGKKSLATWLKVIARKRVAKLQRKGLLPVDVVVGDAGGDQ